MSSVSESGRSLVLLMSPQRENPYLCHRVARNRLWCAPSNTLHIKHTEPSCQIPGHQHTYPQSHTHIAICSAGLKKTVWFEVYKNIFLSQNTPGQASLSLVSKSPWDLMSLLDYRAPNNSSSSCSLLPQEAVWRLSSVLLKVCTSLDWQDRDPLHTNWIRLP